MLFVEVQQLRWKVSHHVLSTVFLLVSRGIVGHVGQGGLGLHPKDVNYPRSLLPHLNGPYNSLSDLLQIAILQEICFCFEWPIQRVFLHVDVLIVLILGLHRMVRLPLPHFIFIVLPLLVVLFLLLAFLLPLLLTGPLFPLFLKGSLALFDLDADHGCGFLNIHCLGRGRRFPVGDLFFEWEGRQSVAIPVFKLIDEVLNVPEILEGFPSVLAAGVSLPLDLVLDVLCIKDEVLASLIFLPTILSTL